MEAERAQASAPYIGRSSRDPRSWLCGFAHAVNCLIRVSDRRTRIVIARQFYVLSVSDQESHRVSVFNLSIPLCNSTHVSTVMCAVQQSSHRTKKKSTESARWASSCRERLCAELQKTHRKNRVDFSPDSAIHTDESPAVGRTRSLAPRCWQLPIAYLD